MKAISEERETPLCHRRGVTGDTCGRRWLWTLVEGICRVTCRIQRDTAIPAVPAKPATAFSINRRMKCGRGTVADALHNAQMFGAMLIGQPLSERRPGFHLLTDLLTGPWRSGDPLYRTTSTAHPTFGARRGAGGPAAAAAYPARDVFPTSLQHFSFQGDKDRHDAMRDFIAAIL